MSAFIYNNPPTEPHHVQTDLPMESISEGYSYYEEIEKNKSLEQQQLRVDVHVESGCTVKPDILDRILTACPFPTSPTVWSMLQTVQRWWQQRPHSHLVKFLNGRSAKNVFGWSKGLHGLRPTEDEQPKLILSQYLYLYYPMGKPANLFFQWPEPLPRFVENLSVGTAVYMICQGYRYVYERPEEYQIWGHALSDLYIEGFSYYPQMGLVVPLMGS